MILRRASAMEDRGRRYVQIKAGAADEAGKFITFGRMTDEARRFVDDQQVRVFVDDVEQVFQARGDDNHGWTRIFSEAIRR